MEVPYLVLLRASWHLWWRYWFVLLGMAALLLLPPLVVAFRYPIVWEAIAASDAGSPWLAVAVFLTVNALVCYPAATRWLLADSNAPDALLESDPALDGVTHRERDRHVFLVAWSIFWMPFVWDCLNLGLAWLVAWTSAGHPRLIPALAVIALNTAILSLFAILPLNVRWALLHSFLGKRWRLRGLPA